MNEQQAGAIIQYLGDIQLQLNYIAKTLTWILGLLIGAGIGYWYTL